MMETTLIPAELDTIEAAATNPAPITTTATNRKILHAAFGVALAGVTVKLLATAKELVVAAQFGRTDAMDAFLMAFLAPGLLVNLFSESMNQALIPTLVRVREVDGRDEAQRLLTSALGWTCLLLASGAAMMGLLAHVFFPVIAPHFAATKLALTEHLLYGLLPVVLLAGLASTGTAVLNTEGRFAGPALYPMAVPLGIMVAAAWGAPQWGIWTLEYGCVAGTLTQALLVIWAMERHGFRFRLDLARRGEALREVAGQYGPVLLSGLVASGGLLVDQAMAAWLGPGSVSTLVYGNRFVSAAMNLLAGAIATAATPYLSEMVARRDWAACRNTVHTYVWLTAAVSVPVALAMIFGSRALIALTLQHGAFHSADTNAVAPVQAMYAIQLPFYVVSRVYYRYLVAIRRTTLILYCGAINLALDIVLNLICMRWMGIAGIALATSLWTVSTFVFLGYWTYRLLPPELSSREGSDLRGYA
ncbi:murein biosynthesis integral membrane protein MurJ [Acidicapsa dinghuensis]|uniref:Murein biosynthesis integral membrane protein MurJ n=1 Tax=Acidicapsa dinghuensis TaxID=2218256 RepID=A0ABW1EKS0_9BACT|nr:lipid II flippase MurJ [Acidicapsa dinghuensis]